MEERFLNEISEYFPKMKFSLINKDLSNAGHVPFGYKDSQTLKAGRKKIKLSWSPPIEEKRGAVFDYLPVDCRVNT